MTTMPGESVLRIRVYTVDAQGKRREIRTATVTEGEAPDIMSLGLAFPPCACPRCQPRSAAHREARP